MFVPYRAEGCVFGRHCRSRILNYTDAELLPMSIVVAILFSDNHQNSAAFSNRYTASTHYLEDQ